MRVVHASPPPLTAPLKQLHKQSTAWVLADSRRTLRTDAHLMQTRSPPPPFVTGEERRSTVMAAVAAAGTEAKTRRWWWRSQYTSVDAFIV
ncbi:hypothetical protein E2C01_035839 [Portunus trituberculatus]|uniref:Uncharacterized protein n=1 Tax=Portunus trituberculatus TaxID=210409 RepID=A0A5B7FAT3_PORTR|nr:hypothetical protein [Portunus trituberculatus]